MAAVAKKKAKQLKSTFPPEPYLAQILYRVLVAP